MKKEIAQALRSLNAAQKALDSARKQLEQAWEEVQATKTQLSGLPVVRRTNIIPKPSAPPQGIWDEWQDRYRGYNK